MSLAAAMSGSSISSVSFSRAAFSIAASRASSAASYPLSAASMPPHSFCIASDELLGSRPSSGLAEGGGLPAAAATCASSSASAVKRASRAVRCACSSSRCVARGGFSPRRKSVRSALSSLLVSSGVAPSSRAAAAPLAAAHSANLSCLPRVHALQSLTPRSKSAFSAAVASRALARSAARRAASSSASLRLTSSAWSAKAWRSLATYTIIDLSSVLSCTMSAGSSSLGTLNFFSAVSKALLRRDRGSREPSASKSRLSGECLWMRAEMASPSLKEWPQSVTSTSL
mmetsp:Transcript_10667/g.21621  ORF Transcript_10667/g.21621 Transcript_10667/m.21621 type:complete len:286 (-) Transcript_10667:551-1408(-)